MLERLARLRVPSESVRVILRYPMALEPAERNNRGAEFDSSTQRIFLREEDAQKHRRNLQPDLRSDSVLLVDLPVTFDAKPS